MNIPYYEYGDRIGRTARIRTGSAAVIYDSDGKILLTRRSDNGRWCLPSGAMDPGENLEETCIREVWEETGLHVKIKRLVGIYSTPHRVTVYAEDNRWQLVGLCFVAEIVGGRLGLSDETTEVGFYPFESLSEMDILEPHLEWITDAQTNSDKIYIK
ncbi:MAG: NUDIX domain-containing protein [Chloroflexi bacterium]|uniref:NUDIX domain-containing protein n=1 Tax=Candidatus Chlorohelix allophototropha TaxID=3003348 RepID=A0A8T7M8A7_9CHLR|nr:NUDIX domain-containing protein [Chloroflexota bacterium]WJW68308.1 NUDIX domain-containing protein [Chloroflexota bacterium L227-S17]